MKATHTGECQVCGATQKLPGGTLSNHGYNVQWNMFNGICQGSGYIPYQVSYDRITEVLESARKELKAQDNLLDAAMSNDTLDGLHRKGYELISGKGHIDIDQIDSLHAVKEDDTNGTRYFWTSDGKQATWMRRESAKYASIELRACRDVQANYIRGIRRTIKRLEQYCEWQSQRIVKWTYSPSAVVPIEN